MISRIFRMVGEAQRLMTDLALLLTNPTSIVAAIGLFLQFFCAAVLSLSIPLTLRWLILPSSVESTVPLNLVFDACKDEVHAICSFPTATLNIPPNELFSSSTYYALSVKLQFAEVESSKKLGLFQNVLRAYDEQDRLMREYSKTSYVKEPSIFKKATWMLFLPLYLTGFFSTAVQLEVPLTMEHYENPSSPTSKLLFQLQNRFAEVEFAELKVTAQFGLVRHLLYYYPMITCTVMWLPSFLFLALVLFLNWGMKVRKEVEKGLEKRISKTDSDVLSLLASDAGNIENREALRRSGEDAERDDLLLTPSSSSSSTASFEELHLAEAETDTLSDEFIPENVHELPECVPHLEMDSLSPDAEGVTQPSLQTPAALYISEGPRKRR